MNIHPLFVHFPIALLTLYALMQLVPSTWKARFLWWKGAGTFLIMVGWLSTLPTGATGGIAEELIEGKVDSAIIETHAMFAGLTILTFFVFFAGELVRVFQERGWGERIASRNALLFRVWNWKIMCSRIILDTAFTKVLALVGIALLTITGGLGGVIVYGPEADFVSGAVYHLFF